MPLHVPRRCFDRSGAVVGGEVPGRTEPAEVSDDREDGGGADVADPEDRGQVEPCASRASCSRVSVAGDAPVTPTPVLQQLLGHLAPRCFDRRGWPVMRLLRSPDRVLVASTGSQ
jgi:hypothetical protein